MASNFVNRPETSNRDGRSLLLPDGPWTHTTQNAAGANFHVAHVGPEDGEVVFLLHDFPRTWYSMRQPLVALGDAGYRAYAIDLRGFGTSDLQPYGQDPLRMSADVIAIMASLGHSRAHIIGAGMGGQFGWILAATHPEAVRSLMAIATPHPLTLQANPPSLFNAAGRTALRTRLPWLNVKALRSGVLFEKTARTWGGSHTADKIFEDAPTYRYAFSRPFAAQTALEAVIRANALSRRTTTRIDKVVDLPISNVICREDGLRPIKVFLRDQQWAKQPITSYVIDDSGHFPTEEAPERLCEVILDHMQRVSQN